MYPPTRPIPGLRSASPTKIDFWSVYEDAINKFGHIGLSSSGSGQGASGVQGQQGSEVQEERINDSTSSLQQLHHLYLVPNHKGHLIQHRPEDDEFKNRLVELKVKHIQDLLGHSQTSLPEQITVPINHFEDSTLLNDGSLEQRLLDAIESPEAEPVTSKGSVPPSSDGTKDAVKLVQKKVVKRRRKPVSDAGDSLTRNPRPRLTVTDDDVTTTDNDR